MALLGTMCSLGGIVKLRKGDRDGGSADIAAAVALDPHIRENFAALGVVP
jgi:hypothetical protein